MLAIHNVCIIAINSLTAANAFAKLSKCQQFTTHIHLRYKTLKLQTLLQSYQNVSNSQLSFFVIFFNISCKRFCKVIKMLAIHNTFYTKTIELSVANAFAKLSKCQQFTTYSSFSFFKIKLQTLLQSYQNVSNSQLFLYQCNLADSCKRFCKVIKMLAIHNHQSSTSKGIALQTLLQSYQNVSNSQQRF